jgi:DNA-binding transcriptional ArsR family regulator
MQEHELDIVFHALSSQVRRQILDILVASPGCRVSDVVEHFELSRIGVLKHINVLEEAGLVISRKEGRDRSLFVNLAPLQIIHERWSDRYRSFWAGRLTRLKYAVERSDKK